MSLSSEQKNDRPGAVQLAKWKGAYVIAVASGRHENPLRELGADEFIDYTKHNAENIVSGIDLVMDAGLITSIKWHLVR